VTTSTARPTSADGWEWATVADVADVHLGKMLDAQKQTGQHPRPYLRNINIRWHSIDTDDLRSMDIAPHEVERFAVRVGDVLACEGGEPGRCAVVSEAQDGLAYQKALHRVRPLGGVDPHFLAYALEHLTLTGVTAHAFTGSTIKHLPLEKIKSLRVPVPPAAEQRRIAEHLSGRFSELDAAQTDLRRLLALLAALRVSIARQFLPEPGEATATIGELATVGSGATPLRADAAFWTNGMVPWITSGDLNARRVGPPRQFVTEAALAATAVRLWPPGTLLVAMYGEGQTRGRCSLLTFEATTNQACAGILLGSEAPITAAFLQGYFEATYERNRKLAAGGVQPNLSLGLIKTLVVPVRTSWQQEQLVEQYERTLEQIAVVDEGLRSLSLRMAGLRRALLASAMSGRLPLGRATDEPAGAVLARIAADRSIRPTARGTLAGTVRQKRAASAASPVQETA